MITDDDIRQVVIKLLNLSGVVTYDIVDEEMEKQIQGEG